MRSNQPFDRLSLSLLCVAVGLGVTACEAPLEGEPVARQALCTEVVRVVCDADASCFPDTAREDCVEVQEARCEATLQPLVEDPRLGYDAARAGHFVHDLRVRGEACFAEPLDYDLFLSMFEGTGETGADCTPATLDARALRISSLSCGAGSACRIHLRADGRPEGVCEVRHDAACSHPQDCGSDQFCSLASAWQPGLWGECRPLRTDGWSCSSDLECASRHCDGTCGPMPAIEQPLVVDYPAVVLAEEPLSYLRFAPRSTRFADVSGHGHTVTPMGSIGHAEEGISEADEGGSLELSGEGAYVVLRAPGLAEAEAFSLEVWFRRGEIEASRPLLELFDGDVVGTHLWNHDRGDKIYANVIEADPMEMAPAHTIMSGEGTVRVDTWHHAVLTFEDGTALLYLDGTRIGETSVQGALALDGDLHIGHRAAIGESAERFYQGRLDEIAVYDHALDAPTVRTHHDVGVRGERVNGFPLFGWLAQ